MHSIQPAERHDTPRRQGATATEWHVEAESHLRQAGRALEVLGLVDNESARLALVVYRLASRVRADRTGVSAT